MSNEVTTKPGTLDLSITNSGLHDGLITGQGQKVTVTGSGENDTTPMPADSEEEDFQKLLRLLQNGISVNQSIRNSDSSRLIIVGQGQSARLHGVNINTNNNHQGKKTKAKKTSDGTTDKKKWPAQMSLC